MMSLIDFLRRSLRRMGRTMLEKGYGEEVDEGRLTMILNLRIQSV